MGLLVTPWQWCAACAAGWALVGICQAAEDRGLHGSVGLSAQYDNNLFRLPQGVTPAAVGVTSEAGDDGSHRNDTTTSPFATLEARWALGRQHVGVALARRETRLQRYGA